MKTTGLAFCLMMLFSAMAAAVPAAKPPAKASHDDRHATPAGNAALQMVHLPFLKRATMFQWSSFSHPSANDDAFYYPDPNARGFNVLIDVKGPGCFYHWWSTGGMGNVNTRLKFYFDGEPRPRFDGTIGDLRGSDKAWEFLGYADNAPVSFLPMPFRKRLVVSTDGPTGEEFHHAYVHTYPTAEGIESFTGHEDLSSIRKTWDNVGRDPKSSRGNRTVAGETAIAAGEAAVIYDRSGQESIASLTLDAVSANKDTLNNTWIVCTWDGCEHPQIEAPLTWFFGASDLGPSDLVRTLPVGMGRKGPWYCYFPMPYWSSARIAIENRSSDDLPKVRYEVQYKPSSVVDYPKERCGYFHTTLSRGPTRCFGPQHTVLSARGAGHIVGIVWAGRTGENDEMAWIDDHLSPQFWGTGGEDYPLQAYGMRDKSYPFSSGTKSWRWNRYHISDVIPFQKNIHFTWENSEHHVAGWWTPNSRGDNHTSLCMYYLNPEPSLVMTDELDVGDGDSESIHDYRLADQKWRGVRRYIYQGDYRPWSPQPSICKWVTDSGVSFDGFSEFTVRILEDNEGVRLRRRTALTHIQEARVFVDGVEVTESRFYCPISYRAKTGFYEYKQLWRDIDFEIPSKYTAGKAQLRIRVEHVPSTEAYCGDWSDFYYWVYSYRSRRPVAGPPVAVYQPAVRQVVEGEELRLQANVLDGRSFQWLKNGKPIVGATAYDLIIQRATLQDVDATYNCAASNEHGRVFTAGTVVKVTPDREPPRLDIVRRAGDIGRRDDVGRDRSGGKLHLEFSEPVDPETAQNPANYTVRGTRVVRASLDENNPSMVHVETSTDPDVTTSVRVSVRNVRDRAQNPNVVEPVDHVSEELSGENMGLDITYYEIEGLSKLPDFDKLTGGKDGTVPNVDLAVRDRDRDFAVRFHGLIVVPEPARFEFYLTSAGGSRLTIDGKVVVDHDGLHAKSEKRNWVTLTEGEHDIAVDYFNAGAAPFLTLEYRGPNLTRRPVPNNVLFRKNLAATELRPR